MPNVASTRAVPLCVFVIIHVWCGPTKVLYQAAGFLDKNKDSLPEGVVSAIMGSGVSLVTVVMSKGFKTTRSQLKTSIHMKPWLDCY